MIKNTLICSIRLYSAILTTWNLKAVYKQVVGKTSRKKLTLVYSRDCRVDRVYVFDSVGKRYTILLVN